MTLLQSSIHVMLSLIQLREMFPTVSNSVPLAFKILFGPIYAKQNTVWRGWAHMGLRIQAYKVSGPIGPVGPSSEAIHVRIEFVVIVQATGTLL